jgi:beta-1,4-mannosyltransferase
MRVLASPAFKNRSTNPYNSILYSAMTSLGVEVREATPRTLLDWRFDVWHHHWPDIYLNYPSVAHAARKIAVFLASVDFARARGSSIVWTVHNLGSHDRQHPRLEDWFWHRFTARLDGFLSLSEEGLNAARERFPGLRKLPGLVVPHGHYRGQYPDTVERRAARERLGIHPEAVVITHVGRIREYKNVPLLVRTFRSLPDQRAVLLVAGDVNGAPLRREIDSAVADDPRVKMVLELVPEPEMQLYLKAADLVVLPYADILHSGSAILALSFDRPVLIPSRGAMRELHDQIGGDWVRTFDGELSRGILEDAIDWALETPRPARAPLDRLEWDEIARSTVDAYMQVREAATDRRTSTA